LIEPFPPSPIDTETVVQPLSRASRPVLNWVTFVLALSGSFYVLMTISLVMHEIFGHGLAAILCGARGMKFSVNTGFAGWAVGTEPPSPQHVWIITYAGIAVNLLIGLGALGWLRLRRPRLSLAGLVLYWLGTTELGHALGYTLQGLIFHQGDADRLPLILGPSGRVLAMVFLGGLFLLLAWWTLSGAAGFIRDHFQSPSLPAFRAHFFVGFTLPMAAIILWAPGLPRRDTWTIVAFDLCVLTVLFLVTAWSVRRMPRESQPRGVPIGGWAATAWTTAALAAFAVTYLWLTPGVTIMVQPG